MKDDAGGVIHATCVDVNGFGILIRGASGSGKSSLALRLMAHGARLVADDRTSLQRNDNAVWASSPPAIRGAIEARGIGLLAADPVEQTKIALVVDLDSAEPERLPPKRQTLLLGIPIDLVFGATSGHLPYGLLQLAHGGRWN
ncbi:HPr kinase/phosphorylase [Pseudorhodobacter aquimaris]|uniref:HPr kinase/phosphorylase n=1 Tax=Pseudorhodobacter aquimaris TaxID=687412 RepID=UPI000AC0A2BE|nr:HPr kinase/phosphatase C-terminal domain-containing protein [Pseudorhodobacter aquimaris]